jgi:M6 family metalloprotease-like protein
MRTSGHYPSKKLSVPVCLAILFLIAMALPPCVESAPLTDFPVTVKQPDGMTLHLYVSGDEHYNRLHDQEGYTIIQDPATGYYVYAGLDPDGDLVSSGYAVGSVHPKTIGLGKGIMHAPEKIREKVATDRFLRQQPLLEGREPLLAPKTGTINNLVVFIRFSDEAEFTDALNTYDAMFNNKAAGANSMANYFREVSYDQLSISTTFYPNAVVGNVRSYQDSHPRAYYQPYNAVTNPGGYQDNTEQMAREETLLKNAVSAIATLVPSSLNVDEDNDGNVDNICFIIYGAPDAWSNLLWPKRSGLSTQEAYIYDKRVWSYNLQLQALLPTLGVGGLAHEMLHSIGFPDLYHYNPDAVHPVWKWDIMGENTNPPQHPLAYMKHRYGGWIDAIPTITAPGTYSLKPLTSSTNNAYRINSPYTADEYFLVEYRRKTGTFEGSLPGEGLLVYRIIRNQAGQGDRTGPPDEVYVYRPQGAALGWDGWPEKAAFSSNSRRTVIYDGSDPAPYLSNDFFHSSPGGLFLYNISAIADTISFTVSFPPFLATTGQTQSYATGDDGEIQSGIAWPAPRFAAAGECIQDNLTGLLWTKRGNLPAPPGEWQYLSWGDAIDYAKSLSWCGCSTWRLPNINEIESLLNIGSLSPYSWLYGQGFSDVGAAKFWTSTFRAVDLGTQNPTAWTQEFFDGKMAWAVKGTWDYTWPVCGAGTDTPAKLLETGQYKPDRDGDDGTYHAGRDWPATGYRFKVIFCNDVGPCPGQNQDCDTNEWNDLVIDGATGLIWSRYASSIGLAAPCNKSIFKNWQNGLDYIECLNDNQYLGFKDWRLPNKNELRSLIDYSRWSPAIDKFHPFISAGGMYWSSTTVGTGGEQTKAVLVDLTYGQSNWALKTNSTAGYGVWPVRTAKAKVSNAILSVTKAGAGQGTVTSYPDGIACGATCSFSFDAGQSVTLAVSASAGSAFSGWSGCDSLTGNNCNVTMNDDRGVTATFAVPTYLLTVNKLGQGSGTVTSTPLGIDCGADCSESYKGGDVVTLTAAADSGSAFLQWSGCDSTAGNTCTVAMTSNKVVGATFVPLYTLTATKSGAGAGAVTSSPPGIACGSDCGEPYPQGTVATLTATPAQGSVFSGWSGGGCSGTGTCTVTVNGDTTVNAAFTPGYSLTVTRQGGGSGKVASNPAGINCGTECFFSYITGVQVTLTATPTLNSVFAGWTGCDATSENTCTVTMVTNKFVYASFNPAANVYALTVTKSGTGKGKVASSPTGINCGSDCSEKYAQGTQVTLTATPTLGSTFTGWSGGGCNGTGTCMVTMSSKTTVNAVFTLVPPPYTLTVTKSGTGKGKVASSPAGIDCGSDCGEKYVQGTQVTLTATPTLGSIFTGWSGGGCSGTDPCTVTMTSSLTVATTFTLTPCTYSLAPTSKAYPAAGGSVTVTITGSGRKVCPRPVVDNPYSWLAATTPTWAQNKGQVKLTALANSSSVERSGTVTIGGTSFPVTQAGIACAIKKLTVAPSSYPDTGQLGTLTVQVAPQECAWMAAPSAGWIHLLADAGTGDAIIPFIVEPNSTSTNRTGTISIILSQPPNKKKMVTVTQGGS